MNLLTAKEFKGQSVSGRNSSERIFKKKTLIAGPIFSLTKLKVAKLYCKNFCKKSNNSLCIIVQEENFFRIWNEDKKLINDTRIKGKENYSNSISLKEEFLEICQKKLAKEIGPVAQVICKKTIAKNPQITRLELVEILAKRIPDVEIAKQFKQELSK